MKLKFLVIIYSSSHKNSNLDLDLGSPVPSGTLGDELSRLITITGNASGFMSVTATDTHVLQIFSTCILPCPFWPASSSTSSLRSPIYHQMAGGNVGRRSTCPMKTVR